jgi:DNA repair protein RecO (recombination protein O)
MSKTYQATGIILKGMPLGEADRLVTILTPEFGLIRAVAPGARKHKSSLRGRSELFVVNQLLMTRGRSLDKIIQAETIESYPGLSRDVVKLAGGQYLAELALSLALSEQPQGELYTLLNEHLRRLEQQAPPHALHPYLAQALFHLLIVAGLGPQVQACCLSQASLTANFNDPLWRVGFSFEAGGLVNLARQESPDQPSKKPETERQLLTWPPINTKLGAVELSLLQHLGGQGLPQAAEILPQQGQNIPLEVAWMRVERLLRDYAQYQVGRSFRSAVLLDRLSPLEF